MDKIKQLLASRKFWALVASLASIGAGVASKSITASHAVDLVVIALSAYKVGTAIEGAPKMPPVSGLSVGLASPAIVDSAAVAKAVADHLEKAALSVGKGGAA